MSKAAVSSRSTVAISVPMLMVWRKSFLKNGLEMWRWCVLTQIGGFASMQCPSLVHRLNMRKGGTACKSCGERYFGHLLFVVSSWNQNG